MITKPFGGENPFGQNVNYDPDFDILKNEMGKLGGIDYDVVEQKATTILRDKSKDVRAVAFLSLVLLRKDRWEQVADLFEGFSALAEQDFDRLFPERPNAKLMAIKWLSEDRFTDVVNQRKPAEADHEHVRRLMEALGRLKVVLDRSYPNGSPFPAGFYGKAMTWEKSCKPKPQNVPQAGAVASPGAPGAAPGPAVAQPAAIESPKQAQTTARTVARFLIEKEPQRIMGYRLVRCLRWDLLEKAPPAEGGKTQLPGPNPQQRVYFQNLFAQREWKALFDKAEEAFGAGSNHLWIDLQRFSAMACKEMGPAFEGIRNAIMAETAFLMKRVPEIASLLFSDASPMCDDATKAWISSEVSFSGTPQGGTRPDQVPADPVDKETQEVNGLMAAGQIEKALGLLQRAIRASADEAQNFRRGILVGTLLLKAKRPEIAVGVLESLDQRAETYHLDRWYPDLAVEAWGVLAQAYKAGAAQKSQPVQAALLEKHAAILGKICRVDPKRAYQLNTQTPQ